MKSLEQIRQYISEEVGYVNWDVLVDLIKNDSELITFYTDMVASEYAEQALDEAADKVTLELDEKDPYRANDYPEHQRECLGDGRDGNILAYINRDSILSVKEQLK